MKFTLRQEPLKGKACGIDGIPTLSYLYPGLVLLLEQDKSHTTKSNATERKQLEALKFVCCVSLIDPSLDNGDICACDANHVKVPKSLRHLRGNLFVSPLAGQRVSTGTILNDPVDGMPKLFFIFPDLSVRIVGEFKLKCSLMNLDKYSFTKLDQRSCIRR
jgi:hypothetical protein